ncbi:hypothetical protein D7X74_01455 [Corallococcus sp. CA047B]|nr:hypothetical protein D7X74_01455 [Corallococcus sp. CA047B]
MDVSGSGFGKSTVFATFTDNANKLHTAQQDIYVGTVVIAGANGSFWQVFSDGGIRPISDTDVHPDAQTMIKNNAIFSDLTGNSTSTAVTCYLLNLKSYTIKPS